MVSTANKEGFMIRAGGRSRAQLLQLLLNKGVLLNSHAETLLAHPAFEAPTAQSLRIVERTVGELGFKNGAVQPSIFAAARSQGLELCPLVTGPYLRLAMTDQAKAPDTFLSAGRAPIGAIHVASMPLNNNVEDPKGFYLRVVDGQPWLRGYRCDDTYLWDADQRFAFLKTASA